MSIQLRRAFKTRGARIECLNFKFDDTPEGEFIETILAAQGQLERQQIRCRWNLALRGTMLTENPARPSFKDAKLSDNVIHTRTATRGA